MTRTSICVLGSANMDLIAVVERAPQLGETVTGRRFEQMPGGKGANQALAAARAGAAVRMLGAVGDDAFGARIRAVLEADGVDLSGLSTAETPTGTAHITVNAEGDNSIVVVPGANGTMRELTDAHRTAIEASDTLVLQLELPLGTVVDAARHARRCGVRVILTPSPVVPLPAELLTSVDLIVPNEREAALLTRHGDPRKAARALIDTGAASVVVTLGERGCLYLAAGSEDAIVQPAVRVEAVDTTAAGDTFVGCLAVALTEGRNLRDALRWASVAAALSVQRFGASASMPVRSEIDAATPT